MPPIGDHPTGALDDFSKNAPFDIMNTDEGAFEEADDAMTAEGARAGSWAYAEEDEEGEEDGTRDESMDLGMEASLRRGVYAALSQYDSERAGHYWGTASNGNSEERRTRSTTSARSTPSPTAFSPHPSRVPSRQTREQLWAENQRLRELLRQQESQISLLTAQRDNAEHCWIMFQRHNAVLCHRLNAMPRARGERRFNPIPMSYMQVERISVAAARSADAAEGFEDEAQKGGAARDRDARRAIASTVFSGSLRTKAKAQLQDIASALGLPVEGTKKVVVERIQAHLDATPALADHPRFAGLRARRT